MSKRLKILMCLLCCIYCAVAQIDLSRLIRLADEGNGEYTILEADDLDVGEIGENITWNFSDAEILCAHKIFVSADDSLLSINMMRNTYHYRLEDSTLRWYAFENRLTRLADSIGSPAMHFPFCSGDSIGGNIDMFGHYSTYAQCMERGEIWHSANAYGNVILPDHTIRNVLRVKTVRRTKTFISDSVSVKLMHACEDSLPIFEQTDYRWFCNKFVLPIARRSDWKVLMKDSVIHQQSQSFILEYAYHSTPQDDEDNDNHTDKKQMPDNSAEVISQSDGYIEVQYTLGSEYRKVEIAVCDITGKSFHHSIKEKMSMGAYSEKVSMAGAPAGLYLFVVKSGDEIILKQLFDL